MVLELKPPQRADLQALIPLWPGFMGYVLSFIDVGICWTKLQYVSYPSIWGFTLTLLHDMELPCGLHLNSLVTDESVT